MAPAAAPARPAPRAVVLRAAADVVRHGHVERDVVVLADRELVHRIPVAARVPRLRHAAVVADDDVRRVLRVDPHRVMVDVHVVRRVARRLAAVPRVLDAACSTRTRGPDSSGPRAPASSRTGACPRRSPSSHVLPAVGRVIEAGRRLLRLHLGILLRFAAVSASTCVYITSGSDAAMAMLMRPFIVPGNPPPFTSVHVSPASVLFQSAEPGPPDWRKYGPRTRS